MSDGFDGQPGSSDTGLVADDLNMTEGGQEGGGTGGSPAARAEIHGPGEGGGIGGSPTASAAVRGPGEGGGIGG
jgi:hypothetical protein